MARKFVAVGLIGLALSLASVLLGLTLGSGSLMGDVNDLSLSDMLGAGVIITLLSPLLGSFGTMFFLAGLIGLAVNEGKNGLGVNRVAAPGVCGECGEAENPVGSLYCRTCGAQLQTD
ncbi:MAG: hypothetical protein ACYC6T_15210 [Thermoleophilia bacterium]